MTQADETELHRLRDMLQAIEGRLGTGSPLKEALRKAGIALAFSFIQGSRSKIEFEYESLQKLRRNNT